MMKKIAVCAILGGLLCLTACGGAATQEEITQEETTQAEADAAWRDGMNYISYSVNDKNGARNLWVDFGEESADVYEDDGTLIVTLNYGALEDIEYAKEGFAFEDTDNDGYVDISMPYVKNEFGSYTYHWIYNFVDRVFMDKTSELTNEKEVLWLIANGILGTDSSRQITQVFNNPDIGVINGNITLDGHVCKAYSVIDSGRETARLYFDQNGGWYIDEGCRQIYSVISSVDDTYILNGVCSTERARAIVSYTLSDYYSNPQGVASSIVSLWEAAGDSTVAAESVQGAVNSTVSAYEIVIDDEGTIRRMPGGTNVFDMACAQIGINQEKYANLR